MCKAVITDEEEDYIEPNFLNIDDDGKIPVLNIVNYAMINCDENSTLHLMSIPDNDVNPDFATYFKEGQLTLFDMKNSKDYTEFCLDKGFNLGPYSPRVSQALKKI